MEHLWWMVTSNSLQSHFLSTSPMKANDFFFLPIHFYASDHTASPIWASFLLHKFQTIFCLAIWNITFPILPMQVKTSFALYGYYGWYFHMILYYYNHMHAHTDTHRHTHTHTHTHTHISHCTPFVARNRKIHLYMFGTYHTVSSPTNVFWMNIWTNESYWIRKSSCKITWVKN